MQSDSFKNCPSVLFSVLMPISFIEIGHSFLRLSAWLARSSVRQNDIHAVRVIHWTNDNRAHCACKANKQLLAVDNLKHIKHIFGVKRDFKRFTVKFFRFKLLSYTAKLSRAGRYFDGSVL